MSCIRKSIYAMLAEKECREGDGRNKEAHCDKSNEPVDYKPSCGSSGSH